MSRYEELQAELKDNEYKWLVTGAAGFIGSNLVEKLLTLNQKVVGLDNFETGYQHNLDEAIGDAQTALTTDNCQLNTDNFCFIEGDIRHIKTCHQACKGVDYLLHQAALGSVPRSIEDPIRTNRANIDGFLNMLVASRDAKVKHFVYAASSSTYGDHPDLPKVEEKIGNPLSPYAVTKPVNELYATVFAKTYSFNTIGLRYFNISGKRQDPDDACAAIIPKWASSIIKGEEVFINGDGETSRDFCHIENTAQVSLLAATTQNEEAINQVYNTALNDQTSLSPLYQMIEERLIERLDGLQKKEPSYRGFRAGDVRHSQAETSKALNLSCYHPSHKIAEGLDKAMDWCVNPLS